MNDSPRSQSFESGPEERVVLESCSEVFHGLFGLVESQIEHTQ